MSVSSAGLRHQVRGGTNTCIVFYSILDYISQVLWAVLPDGRYGLFYLGYY